MNRQPQLRVQPKDWGVAWAYDLHPHAQGNCTRKPMIRYIGKKILEEHCYHFGLINQFEEIKRHTKARLATTPYTTSLFMSRYAGGRPGAIPDGCVSLGLLGQFVEAPDDCVFTTEGSAYTAIMAVCGLLDLDRDIPPIWPAQYDARALLAAVETMNDGRPLGEKVLGRFLRGTYYENILP